MILELITSEPDSYSDRNSIALDLISHVHKRIESFHYLDDFKSDAVPLDYFESSEIDSKYNLFISDRSHQIPANSLRKIDARSGFEKINATSFSSSYSDVLITNKTFVDELNRERPLFFKHKLPENTVDVQLETVQVGNSIPVDTGYLVSLEDSAIYTNYYNYFDQETGSYKLYFIISTNSSGEQNRTLLSPVSLVEEGTWEDIDPDTGEFYTNISVYSKEKNTSGYTYYFNKADTWWIKPQLKSLIRCRFPAGRKSDEPWYIRVSNGDVSTISNSAARRYWLPEYLSQPYQPWFPYIYSSYNKMLYVNDRVISATRGSLAIAPSEGRHVTVYIKDFEGNLLKVWTTNSSFNKVRYSNTNIFYETDKILCWDNQSGLIVLTESLLPSWQFFAEYYYEADDLEYTGLNVNPVQNKDLLNKTIVFYIVPNADSSDNGLHYLLVEADGRISYCSQRLGFSYPNLQLKNLDGTYNSNNIIGLKYISEIESETFITKYTAGYDNSYAYLVLAEINILDRSSINSSYIYDVRTKGNSLSSMTSEIFAKNPKVLQSIFGYGENGAVVPLNNVVVIQAPLDLLSDYGGQLAEAQATELLKKYLVAGTYPIIEWTYPWSSVDCDVSVTNEVTINWTWEGPDFLYRLYRKTNENVEWVLLYETSSASRTTFSYVDADVIKNDVVYYELRIVKDYEYPAPYYNTVKVK